jgi:hypothetical protein
MMRGGALVEGAPTGLADARQRCADGLASLPPELLRLRDFAAPPTRIGPALEQLADSLQAARRAADGR